MQTRRGPFIYFLILSIASIAFWVGLKAAGAEVHALPWRNALDHDLFRYRGPAIFVIPHGTPEPTPPATPGPDDNEDHPLDGNDYLKAVTADGISLNVDGLAFDKIYGDGTIRFQLAPQNGADPQPLSLEVWTHGEEKYDLRFPDFDEGDYRLTMTYPKGSTTAEYELKPHSRILFSADSLEALLFSGEATPEPNDDPAETVVPEAEGATVFIGANGSLALQSRPVTQVQPTPTPDATSAPTGGNPQTNPPLGGGPTNSPTVPASDFRLGGGGGVFSCSLQKVDRPDPLPPILVMLGIFLLPALHGLSRPRSSAEK